MRGQNLTQRRGSGLDRVEVNSTITSIGFKEKCQKSSYRHDKNAIWLKQMKMVEQLLKTKTDGDRNEKVESAIP